MSIKGRERAVLSSKWTKRRHMTRLVGSLFIICFRGWVFVIGGFAG